MGYPPSFTNTITGLSNFTVKYKLWPGKYVPSELTIATDCAKGTDVSTTSWLTRDISGYVVITLHSFAISSWKIPPMNSKLKSDP